MTDDEAAEFVAVQCAIDEYLQTIDSPSTATCRYNQDVTDAGDGHYFQTVIVACPGFTGRPVGLTFTDD